MARKGNKRSRGKAAEAIPHEDLDDLDLEAGAGEHSEQEEVGPEEQEVWDSVREEQYEVIEQLPLTLHRMFALLRELDEKYTAQVNELQATIREYYALRKKIDGLMTPAIPAPPDGEASAGPSTLKTEVQAVMDLDAMFDMPAAGETGKLLEKIAWLNSESVRTSEEKLALATTAYDLIDRHVRSLDLSIKAEEASFALGLRPGTMPVTSVMQNGTGSGSGGLALKTNGEDLAPKGAAEVNGKASRSRSKPRRRGGVADIAENLQPPPQSPSVDANGVALSLPSMAIDPNEPRYCYCNQVSYGEMIACDNDECEKEWFHYSCAGITETPKRRWFCTDCEAELGITSRKKVS